MAENTEETTPVTEETKPATRRRATRRVSAAAGTVAEVVTVEAPAAAVAEVAEAPAAEAPAAEVPAEAPKKRVTRTRKKAVEPAAEAVLEAAPAGDSAADAAADAGSTEAPVEAPKKRVTRARKKPVAAETTEAAPTETPASEAVDVPASEVAADAQTDTPAQVAEEKAPVRKRAPRRTAAQIAADKAAAEAAAQAASDAPADAAAAASAEAGPAAPASADAAPTDPAAATEGAASDAADSSEAAAPAEEANSSGRSRRSRGRRSENSEQGESSHESDSAETSSEDNNNGNRGRNKNRNGRNQDAAKQERGGQNNQNAQSEGASEKSERSDADRGGKPADSASRSSRTRQRDRKRRGHGDELEPEITEDDVLLPIAGILDVLDNYAFVRTSGYLPGTSDVYVSLGQVKKYGLRKGDAVVGSIRQPREGDNGGRQKYNAIVKVDSINGRLAEENQNRAEFAELTPVHPQQRIRLETTHEYLVQRALDLLAPIGKGQRALVRGQRGTGKSAVLHAIADAVAVNTPDTHLMMVLIDERPEEVTELQRSIKGEVIASTFDRQAEDHTTVAELTIERAKRLVELGHDVVVLIDSLTALGRAYAQRPVHGRPAGENLDSTVLQPLKQLLAAARNVENGGSLTIVATVIEKSGSKSDKVILNEIAGTASSELRLSRELAEAGIAPAVDLAATYTVRSEQFLDANEAKALEKLRASLAASGETALPILLKQLGETGSNTALLAQVLRG